MTNALLQKLKIKSPHIICTLNEPKDFVKSMGALPDGVQITDNPKVPFDSLHWFVKTKTDIDKQSAQIAKLLRPGVPVWCYYPKGTSKIQTDLTRDKGWDTLLAIDDFKWLFLISFNDTWSAFALRLKTDKDKKEVQSEEREIFKYVDSKTKTTTLPEDLAKALAKNKVAKALFDALAFSHRREYVEWVVTAKRENTRKDRIEGTIKLLLEKKKNPHEK
jgi:hypothetical protein